MLTMTEVTRTSDMSLLNKWIKNDRLSSEMRSAAIRRYYDVVFPQKFVWGNPSASDLITEIRSILDQYHDVVMSGGDFLVGQHPVFIRLDNFFKTLSEALSEHDFEVEIYEFTDVNVIETGNAVPSIMSFSRPLFKIYKMSPKVELDGFRQFVNNFGEKVLNR